MIRPKLINGSFGDPFVYASLVHKGRAFCFDMGASFSLTNAELLRVDHVFISHTHMDHIFGFEYFLRANLKHHRKIKIFGPAGIKNNLQGKLKGFSWNLVHGFGLVFEIIEIGKTKIATYRLHSRKGFTAEKIREKSLPKKPVYALMRNENYSVSTTSLEHRIASQAYSVTETETVGIDKSALTEFAFAPGEWLQEVKHAAINAKKSKKRLSIPKIDGSNIKIALNELVKMLIIEKPARKITYITDAAISAKNQSRMTGIAKGSDLLFCESAFLEEDREKAERTRHHTAREAGKIAEVAGVKKLVLFHFGKKYLACPEKLVSEAKSEFSGEIEADFRYSAKYHYKPAFAEEAEISENI